MKIINIDTVAEIACDDGGYWTGPYKPLTPDRVPGERGLGMNATRVPPGKTACPFHTHALEDEVFYILSGRGVLRYGDALHELRAGDCISCPAGTGTAHQLANPFDQDLVYLAVGMNEPNEICTYPDNGKVLVRGLSFVGRLAPAEYLDGEPEVPVILTMAGTVPQVGG